MPRLSGSIAVRHGVNHHHRPHRIIASWADDLAHFERIRRRYLRYPATR